MADPRRLAFAAPVAFSAMLLVAACSGGATSSGPTTAVPLDGTPRYPDAEGIVVDIADDFSTITLDGDRTFGIDDNVQSFSTLDGSVQQLLRREGQYVQVGLEDGSVRWMAGIAAVVRAPGQPPVVYYSGNLVEVRGEHAVFEDGTVLTLSEELDAPPTGARYTATISADEHVVISLSRA